jgi:hypothetical protein
MGIGRSGRFGVGAAIGGALMAMAAAGALLGGCKVQHEGMVPIGTLTQSEEVGAARRLLVRGLSGDIHVKPTDGSRVTVKATVYVRETMHASFSKPDSGRDFRIYEDDNDLVVESCHIDPPTGAEWRIDFDIEAPTDIKWFIDSVQRGIHVEADGNDVGAVVHLGDIEVTGSVGELDLESKLGSVSVDVQSLGGGKVRSDGDDVKVVVRSTGPTADFNVLALQGGIELQLPRSASADLDLRATMGDVEVAGASLMVKEAKKGHTATGVLGKGGVKLQAIAEPHDVKFVVK